MKKIEKLRGSEFESVNGVKCTWVELPYEVSIAGSGFFFALRIDHFAEL